MRGVNTRLAALLGGTLALAGAAAYATPINPLNDVHSASPTNTVVFPTGYGNGTGAAGIFNSPIWYAAMSDGWMLKYDGTTFQGAIDTGQALTGADILPNGSFVLSAGKSLYFGNIFGSNWSQTGNMILPLTSDITDVAYGWGMADYFVATGNGVYAVRNGSLGEKIDTSITQAYDVVLLDKNIYTNDMRIVEGQSYKLLDSLGVPFGAGKLITLNLDDACMGVANITDYQMVVEPDQFQVLPKQDYWEGVIPEPATVLMFGLGGLALALRKGDWGLYLPNRPSK